jgi:hypothetical protein
MTNQNEIAETVESLENWMIETSANDISTIVAIQGLADEIKADLDAVWARYCNGYVINKEAQRLMVSTVRNVQQWCKASLRFTQYA